MTGFESGAPLAISQVDAQRWDTTDRLRFRDSTGEDHDVPIGTRTDLASNPALLTWLVARMTGAPAAVLHDKLWDDAAKGIISYRDADRIFREALSSLGTVTDRRGEQHTIRVAAPTRWLMWAAVRWASLTRPGGWRGWHKDAAAVLAITIPGLILAAPALLLLPSMCLLAAANYISSTFRSKETQ